MRKLFAATLLSLSLAGASLAAEQPPEVIRDTRQGAGEAAPPPADEAFAAALERAPEGAWLHLDLVVECQREERLEILQLAGSGVGVWQGSRQFRLPRSEVLEILDEMRRGGFAAMSPVYGGPPDGVVLPAEGGQGARIICRVVLEIDGYVKQVAQRKRGEQSAELKSLAGGILDRCRQRGLDGVAADSIADGLTKLAAGTLAPEALRLIMQRKPEGAAAREGGGWLLRISGSQATARTHRADVGYGDPISRQLDGKEFLAVVELLADTGFESLPINLWAEQYTDLLVEVLGHRKRIQARGFAGMEPTTHGEAQTRFDRLSGRLATLAASLLSSEAQAGD